jgi:hypothetical protein
MMSRANGDALLIERDTTSSVLDDADSRGTENLVSRKDVKVAVEGLDVGPHMAGFATLFL